MKRFISSLILICLFISSNVIAQLLTEWVQISRSSDLDKIALGYPVPIPVDTPLPFDGFRTYAGLHMRHQDLAATTDYVHPEQIGTTYAGRPIWAYRLGDNDRLTIDGLPEPATLTNGGIHAREWQTPEIVTGILELMALQESDRHFYDYLRDNVNMVVIPSLNIDGFLQTQRTPTLNYMKIDPDYPSYYPRDGRMRRKNMRLADEDLYTTVDILNGVDLNRNNNPYWATTPDRSSPDLVSIIHHGSSPQSESETRALDVAAELGPVDKLRIYTDVHSFSQVHFWVTNFNDRLAIQTEEVLNVFSRHHVTFPAGKWYAFSTRSNAPRNQGIGTTDEYFTNTYQVPSWTLEVEPSDGQDFHAPLPGGGADYGGLHQNGHDGFILPDSEIRRVREQMSQSFAAVFYRQAGPPAIQSIRITDTETGAVVYQARWDVLDPQTRELHASQLQTLQLNRSYDMWLSFNKPMRWRENGDVVAFPGQPNSKLPVETFFRVNSETMNTNVLDTTWLNEPGRAPDGYMNYQDDSVRISFMFPGDTLNNELIMGGAVATLRFRTADMTGMYIDANPGTVADWQNGRWTNYEDTAGNETDIGGYDTTLSFQVTDQPVPPSFQLDASMSSSWYDRTHDGEGFLLEMLANNTALMFWYTFNRQGAQDWYLATGEVHGNRIDFSQLYQASGGEFGPGFDPEKITREVVGSASFIWSGCDEGNMSYQIGNQQGYLELNRLTNLWGLSCPDAWPELSPPPDIPDKARLSGSWFDRSHDGEGFNIEILDNGNVLVFWFSFDTQGNRRWFYGVGEDRNGKIVIDELLTTHGGIFGPDFDPETVENTPWGSLELDIDCNGGTATYNSTEAGFGSGVLNIEKLTNIDHQVSCTGNP